MYCRLSLEFAFEFGHFKFMFVGYAGSDYINVIIGGKARWVSNSVILFPVLTEGIAVEAKRWTRGNHHLTSQFKDTAHRRNSQALNLLISSSASRIDGEQLQFTSIKNEKPTDNEMFGLGMGSENKDSLYSHEKRNPFKEFGPCDADEMRILTSS